MVCEVKRMMKSCISWMKLCVVRLVELRFGVGE